MIMAADASEAVNNAYNKLKMISQDPEIRACSEARELWILGQAIRESEARKEGREEGIEIGREEAIREMVISMHESGMAMKEIANITRLTNEELVKIING
jgi:predicted transposase/invertase (TIGR01784 family)